MKKYILFVTAAIIALFIGASIGSALNENLIDDKKFPNDPPVMQDIRGPTKFPVGTLQTWNFEAIDYDSHLLTFFVDWGDGTGQQSLPIISPSSIFQTWIPHIYLTQNSFVITAYAVDFSGGISNNVTLAVVSPVNRADHIPLFLSFLQKHPNAFSILRQLLVL